uniref:ATP synthase complex subunit 8 n=1 Tax=Leptodactylus melanonotus TaxID=228420 RepID=S4V172_9NEOB|nr:ATP synthase F0 subunit 8 [Leptodactylus melanonotus]
MPQLDPMPWFFILTSSWLIFVLVTPTKVTKYTHLNDPAPQTFEGLNKPWFWPWP